MSLSAKADRSRATKDSVVFAVAFTFVLILRPGYPNPNGFFIADSPVAL